MLHVSDNTICEFLYLVYNRGTCHRDIRIVTRDILISPNYRQHQIQIHCLVSSLTLQNKFQVAYKLLEPRSQDHPRYYLGGT